MTRLRKEHILTPGFIEKQYLTYMRAGDAFYFVDGYFIALRDFGILSEEEYAEFRRLSERAWGLHKHDDNDE